MNRANFRRKAVTSKPIDVNRRSNFVYLDHGRCSIIMWIGLGVSGNPQHRENMENEKKKTQGILIFFAKTQGNTGNLVCSSCKFPDPKGKGYCDICRENSHYFPRSWIGLPSQFCVCNSCKLY